MISGAHQSNKRKRAERTGHRAERYAALYLLICGHEILKRRYKAHGGEIDLISKRGRTLIFSEVKARRHINAAFEAVTARNRRRIETASRQFLAAHPQFSDYAIRFDIIAVSHLTVKRLKDAWREGD